MFLFSSVIPTIDEVVQNSKQKGQNQINSIFKTDLLTLLQINVENSFQLVL